MKAWLCILALIGGAGLAAAAEIDHLEFARGLRARNYPDLALEYLDELSKQPQLPNVLKQLLPIETARALRDMAGLETEPRRQAELYDKARKRLEAFIQAQPKAPQAAEADLDLARILAYQAQGRLHKVQLDEGGPPAGELRAVRESLEQASRRLQLSCGRIHAASSRSGDSRLAEVEHEAELELAINLLVQLMTYTGDRDAEQRIEVGKQALAGLKKLAALDDKNRTAWLARAWLVRYYDEIDAFHDAANMYKRFEKATGPAAEPGRRIALWNYLRLLARKDPNHKDKATLTELTRLANDWLNDYRRDSRKLEGQDVRYLLAEAYRHEAEAIGNPKVSRAAEVMNQAEKLYAELEQQESDYAGLARLHKVQVLVKLRPELASADLDKLSSFNECYLRAQIESEKLNEESRTAPADAKKAEAQRTQHIQNIVTVLTRGLAHVGPNDSAKAQLDARFLLEYYLLLANKPAEAAKLGEEMARAHPESSQAGMAGAYALHALSQVIAEQEKAFAAPESIQGERDRLRKLAEYIEKNWPQDLSADAARHQLGLLALKQKKYAEAVAELGRITPQFGLYGQALYQLASAALQAHKDKLPVPAKQSPWEEQAAAAFARIPEPPPRDVDANRVYVYGRLELAKLDFAAKKYNDMEAVLGKLGERIAREKDPKVQEEQQKLLDILRIYAKYGQAETMFRSEQANRFAKTRELLEPIVKRIQAKQPPELDSKLIHGVLGLAMRACVLDRNPQRAREMLELLQKSAGSFENSSGVLGELGQQLRAQVEELKNRGTDSQQDLDDVIARFTEFLDELAKGPQALKPDLVRFLVSSYAGLGKHGEAAALLEKIPPSEKPDEAKFYHATRVLHAHELRLARKFPEAEKVIRAFLQTDAGKRSLEARKEEAALLEDQQKYAAAANTWKRNMDELKKLRETNPHLADQYHDCLYHYIYCVYHYGKAGDAAARRKFTQRAAQLMVTLERGDPQMGGLKDRYQELLRQEAPLRTEYQAAKKTQP